MRKVALASEHFTETWPCGGWRCISMILTLFPAQVWSNQTKRCSSTRGMKIPRILEVWNFCRIKQYAYTNMTQTYTNITNVLFLLSDVIVTLWLLRLFLYKPPFLQAMKVSPHCPWSVCVTCLSRQNFWTQHSEIGTWYLCSQLLNEILSHLSQIVQELFKLVGKNAQ